MRLTVTQADSSNYPFSEEAAVGPLQGYFRHISLLTSAEAVYLVGFSVNKVDVNGVFGDSSGDTIGYFSVPVDSEIATVVTKDGGTAIGFVVLGPMCESSQISIAGAFKLSVDCLTVSNDKDYEKYIEVNGGLVKAPVVLNFSGTGYVKSTGSSLGLDEIADAAQLDSRVMDDVIFTINGSGVTSRGGGQLLITPKSGATTVAVYPVTAGNVKVALVTIASNDGSLECPDAYAPIRAIIERDSAVAGPYGGLPLDKFASTLPGAVPDESDSLPDVAESDSGTDASDSVIHSTKDDSSSSAIPFDKYG